MQKLGRVTTPTVEVLKELLEATEPRWGLLIVKATGRPAGTVYPILSRLEDSGWIVGRWEDESERSGPRRRLYQLTQDGAVEARQVVAAFGARHTVAPPKPSFQHRTAS